MKRMTNIDSGFVCHCARIRHSELLEIFAETAEPSYEKFKRQYGIGDQCASCEYEVKAILDEYTANHKTGGLHEKRELALRRRTARPAYKERAGAAREYLGRFAKNLFRIFNTSRKINARGCMFFLWTPRMRSSLVVSNVSGPETNHNPNRGAVHFRVRIYDAAGGLFTEIPGLKVHANETREIRFDDALASITGDFVGSLYVEYFNLEVTNTLRPYCVMSYTGPDGLLRSRQHYHDKFYGGIIPGFVQCPSVLMPRRECWVAMTNCGTHDFMATLCLRFQGEVHRVTQHFGPRFSAFRSITEMFGVPVDETAQSGHFWIESERYVMSYFFWHALDSDIWIGQHH